MDGQTPITFDNPPDTFSSETGTMTPNGHQRARANVLGDLFFRHLLPAQIHFAAPPVISANGNVKRDFICVQRHLSNDVPMGNDSWSEAFCLVYGIDSPAEQRNNLSQLPTPPTPEVQQSFWELDDQIKTLRKSLQDMESEALQHEFDDQQAPSYPSIIRDNNDMIAILNARGTVLLNMSFVNTPEQLYIVKLASLATKLWTQRPTDANEEQKWVLLHMIVLIRDDIQQLLLSAVKSFGVDTLQSQQRHIQVLEESVATWLNLASSALRLPIGGVLTTKLEALRDACEAVLAADVKSREIVLDVHSTHNRIEDHGSGYLGPLLRDGEDLTYVGQLSFPGLQRRDTGYWLQV